MNRHIPDLLFLVQKLVEMVVSWIHLRALDRVSDFRRQIAGPEGATLKRAKPLQLFELTGGYEVPAHPAVAGNGDRFVYTAVESSIPGKYPDVRPAAHRPQRNSTDLDSSPNRMQMTIRFDARATISQSSPSTTFVAPSAH